MIKVPTHRWIKFKWGKTWHAHNGDGVPICGMSPRGKKIKFEEEWLASDGTPCKACVHVLADNFPENLIGFYWYEQPEEAELEEVK